MSFLQEAKHGAGYKVYPAHFILVTTLYVKLDWRLVSDLESSGELLWLGGALQLGLPSLGQG